MNKYYANREIIYPFTVINQLEYEKEDVEQRDFADELFNSLLLEIDGRMIGASLLSEMAIGDVIDSDFVEDEDYFIYNVIESINDSDELVVDEDVLLIAKKRLESFKVFYDAIEKAYNETCSNSNCGGFNGN